MGSTLRRIGRLTQPTTTNVFPEELHKHILGLTNVVFGVTLALAASNLKSVIETVVSDAALHRLEILVAGAQLCVGLLIWAIYSRNALLFRETSNLNSDVYIVFMSFSLLLVLLFYATIRSPAPDGLSFQAGPGYVLVLENEISGSSQFLLLFRIPSIMLTAFFASMSGLAMYYAARRTDANVHREIQKAIWTSLFIALICSVIVDAAYLLLDNFWLFWCLIGITVLACIGILFALSRLNRQKGCDDRHNGA